MSISKITYSFCIIRKTLYRYEWAFSACKARSY